MHVLILGGASLRHKEWVRQVAEALKPHFDQVRYMDYRHWETGGESDVAYELGKAETIAAELGPEYIIVAKSIGSAVAVLGVANGRLAPKRCVVLGLPVHILRGEWHAAPDLLPLTQNVPTLENALAVMPATVIVQNEQDPHGSSEEVQKLVTASGNGYIQVLATPGDTHDYLDFALICKLALS